MDQKMMTEYLLGELPSVEREKLEELLFSDPSLYRTLMIAEDRLIDDYLCRQLSQPQRIRFEQYFLISERRREKFAHGQLFHVALTEFTDQTNAPYESLWRSARVLRHSFLVGVLVLSLLLVAAYLLIWR